MFGILGRHYKFLIMSLALLLAAGYIHKLCRTHQGEDNFEYGYYAYENWEEGRMRWTWRRGGMRIRATGDLFGIKVVVCHTVGLDKKPVAMNISVDGQLVDHLDFRVIGSQKWHYWLKKRNKGPHEILIEVSRTWNPKESGINADNRDLGVAVGEPRFLDTLPKDGIGFYPWEKWGGGEIPGWPKDKEKRFRWTGKQASRLTSDFGLCNIKDPSRIDSTLVDANLRGRDGRQTPDMGDQGKDGVNRMVFLMCGHPDIEKAPVLVRILGDGLLLRHVEFEDHGWKKVAVKETELEGKKVITFEVSRTWNPRRLGVSMDERDLGVAVAVP